MAFGSLLALLDDIATVLDDVAAMSKLAAKKTTGVLGDDLALNAQQVSGIRAERELPVVWAVTRGSLKNKLILVPAALLISAVAPWAVMLLLMLGGAYLCFEGAEKVLHSLFHRQQQSTEKQQLKEALSASPQDLMAFEQDKIKGAVRTDFILSAEIIVITLGSVSEADFMTQVVVVALLAVVFTFGVYGIVAAIVKMDDVGLYLSERGGRGILPALRAAVGRGLLALAPRLMKTLTVVGTLAMFLVGGGILVHGLPPLQHLTHLLTEQAVSGWISPSLPLLFNLVTGLAAGLLLVAGSSLWSRLRAGA